MKELQDIRQGSLEQSMMDLNALVERLQKEIDKSAQKKDKLVSENQTLAAQIVQLQAIYKEANIEDPIKFKNDIEEDKNKIQQLAVHNNELQTQIEQLKKQVQKKDDEQTLQKKIITKNIENLVKWADRSLNVSVDSSTSKFRKLSSSDDEGEDRLDDSILSVKTDSKTVQKIQKEFSKLSEVLFEKNKHLSSTMKKQQQKAQNLEGELRQAQGLKQEIFEDFKRLKQSIQTSESSLSEVTKQNESLKQEMISTREQMNQLKDKHQDLEQEFNKLTIEAYNLLYNIRHKFENNPKLTQVLNMHLRFDFTSDRCQAILELASLIGDITNILNYELKNSIIKESQFQELQQSLTDCRSEYEEKISQCEAQRMQELQDLQSNFERKYQRFKEYQIDIEKINLELQEQNQQIRSQIASKDNVIQSLELQVLQLEGKHKINDELNKQLIQGISDAIANVENLIVQKGILKRELKNLEFLYTSTQKAMQYLADKTEQGIVASKASQSTIKQQEDAKIRLKKAVRKMGKPIKALKLRKALIAVIFVNRLKKLQPPPRPEFNQEALTISQIMPVSDGVGASKILQRLKLPYETTEAIQSMVHEKSHYQSQLLSTLLSGNKSIKQHVNDVTKAYPIDYCTLAHSSKSQQLLLPQLDQILHTFKSKEYVNRHLLVLEKTFELQRSSALSFNQRTISLEQDLLRMSGQFQSLQLDKQQLIDTCESQQTHISHIQSELQSSVPREDYERARLQHEQSSAEVYESREQVRQLRERLEKQVRDLEEIDKERRQTQGRLVQLEQDLNERGRDIELKDIKIESLEAIIKKRETAQSDHTAQIAAQLEDKVALLEADREKLIKDNIALIRQIDHFKEEHDKNMKFIHKQDEIQRIYEQNSRSLEERCRFLESHLDQTKKQQRLSEQKHFYDYNDDKENNSFLYNNLSHAHHQQDLDGTIKSPTFQNILCMHPQNHNLEEDSDILQGFEQQKPMNLFSQPFTTDSQHPFMNSHQSISHLISGQQTQDACNTEMSETREMSTQQLFASNIALSNLYPADVTATTATSVASRVPGKISKIK
ncbi:hypothetical protein FGO68_gene10137 [Halteria grandinella]|uniref:Uncharacterized protein n=1 Tax=Halteria grandinella TaxID=5974 RepID=A0A8J8T8S0_HALGN|nr:hypothetical protein FGO68_gene10137 [Halteria grandinella]